MRAGTIIGALALAVGAIAPGAAHAGARADFRQAFTTTVPSASTGTDTQILYKNPSDPNAKPIPVREEVFTFPEGTTWDTSVVPDCTVSDLELELIGPSACPSETRIGGPEGDTLVTGVPGAGECAPDFDPVANDEG